MQTITALVADHQADEQRREQERAQRRQEQAQARVELRANGHSLEEFHDTGIPATDLEAQGAKLAAKMTGLTAPLLGAEASERLRQMSLHLEAVEDLRDLC